MKLRTIKDLTISQLRNKRVLLRLDLNVPIEEGSIVEPYRIDRSLPTISLLAKKGAKVIIISHLGDDGKQSLEPVAKYLNKKLRTKFHHNLDAEEAISKMHPGDVLLLENLRRDPGEKKNDEIFSKKLAGLADLYVNDAFSACHRTHASIVGVAKLLPSYAGLLLEQEIENLEKFFKPLHPFVLILGGVKFSTKVPMVDKFLHSADRIFVGGAIAHTFLRAKGYEIGKSLYEMVPGITRYAHSRKVILPIDMAVEGKKGLAVEKYNEVKKSDVIVDIGPDSMEQIEEAIAGAKFVLWNGPLGNFEKGYSKATLDVMRALAKTKAFAVIGGGDTVSAVSHLNLENKISFVSTGGGAMLEFLASGGKLPGIEAIRRSRKVI
ncbi:MAG: phosphoglycerate kinase [bacterium]